MGGLWQYFESVLGVDQESVRFIDDDFVEGLLPDNRKYQFGWGDAVVVQEQAEDHLGLRVVGGAFSGAVLRVHAATRLRDTPLLRLSLIDVQQGDGMVLETPDGEVVLIDGGENQLFARHVAARFRGTSEDRPLEVDAILVTHGDADHFKGLSELVKSENLVATADEPDRGRKKIFLTPARVLHNGLVKRASSRDGKRVPDLELLGRTRVKADSHYCVDIYDDISGAEEPNGPFKTWMESLAHWEERRQSLGLPPIEIARIGDDSPDRVRFLTESGQVGVDVLGPTVERVDGRPALKFLRQPKKTASLHTGGEYGSYSASHTINGHSIALRISHGNVRFLLTGDLNRESMANLVERGVDLESEVLKTPHHGSHDFDLDFLRAARPVVSLISSGDESETKEYIHPRATMVAALGLTSRTTSPVIFITELAAFFSTRGYAKETKPSNASEKGAFYAFERTNFGIVHLRTDGERLLSFTHSGKKGLNEAYAFSVGEGGVVKPAALRKRSAPPKID